MKLAVLGCGYWGKNLVRNFSELGVLSTIVDPSEAGRAQAAKIAPGVRVLADPGAIWSDDSIDAVALATPASSHAALCREAVLAGKDVLCEKPLALSYHDAARVVALAEERKRILMVGHILEYHPAVLQLRELIAKGELGQVRYIFSNRLNLGKVRREENILWSFAPHDIAVILRLIGAKPFQVVSAGGAYISPNVFDVTVTQLMFDNGVAAHVFVSWLNPFKEQRLVVVGSNKMAVFDDVRRELMVYDQRVDVQAGEPVPVKGEGTKIAYASDEPLRRECEAFIEAVKTRRPPLTDGRSGLDVLRVLQAAQRSLITQGQPIQLPMDP